MRRRRRLLRPRLEARRRVRLLLHQSRQRIGHECCCGASRAVSCALRASCGPPASVLAPAGRSAAGRRRARRRTPELRSRHQRPGHGAVRHRRSDRAGGGDRHRNEQRADAGRGRCRHGGSGRRGVADARAAGRAGHPAGQEGDRADGGPAGDHGAGPQGRGRRRAADPGGAAEDTAGRKARRHGDKAGGGDEGDRGPAGVEPCGPAGGKRGRTRRCMPASRRR
jgi:hypothetical protein